MARRFAALTILSTACDIVTANIYQWMERMPRYLPLIAHTRSEKEGAVTVAGSTKSKVPSVYQVEKYQIGSVAATILLMHRSCLIDAQTALSTPELPQSSGSPLHHSRKPCSADASPSCRWTAQRSTTWNLSCIRICLLDVESCFRGVVHTLSQSPDSHPPVSFMNDGGIDLQK